MKATARQVQMIHVLKAKLGLDDSLYRQLLASYGVSSSVELPTDDARQIIDHLVHDAQGMGVWHGKPRRWDHLGNRPGMASPAQLRLIEALWARVSRADGDVARHEALLVFISRHFAVSALEWITSDMVGKIVHTLHVMYKQKVERNGRLAIDR